MFIENAPMTIRLIEWTLICSLMALALLVLMGEPILIIQQ